MYQRNDDLLAARDAIPLNQFSKLKYLECYCPLLTYTQRG
jgi:hypothetical protein